MQNVELKVTGMMCEGCENRVKNVVSQISNVKEVVADYKTGTVEIKYENELNLEEVKSAIEDLDYHVED